MKEKEYENDLEDVFVYLGLLRHKTQNRAPGRAWENLMTLLSMRIDLSLETGAAHEPPLIRY